MSVSMLETLDNAEGEAVDDVKTMADLPPEILTKLLEYLLDGDRNAVLSYRLVNCQWKSIIGRLLEEKLSSTWLHPFPELELEEFLSVNVPATVSPSDPFPFNSLLIRGVKEEDDCSISSEEEEDSDSQDAEKDGVSQEADKFCISQKEEESHNDSQAEATPLLEFATSFGGNLTTFALEIDSFSIDFSLLANVLGFMCSLKRLSLSNVVLEWPVSVGIPTPPPLTSLTTLELRCDARGEQSFLPYVWLVAVYADQLVRLNLAATDPFLPLQNQHKYHIKFNFMKIFIATSSSTAFEKLKELKIYRPTTEFLLLSETPALQHFSMTGLGRNRAIKLGDLMKFMVNCGDELQTVYVDVNWFNWRRGEWIDGSYKIDQLERTAPNLKKFSIPFPINNTHKTILYTRLLPRFPGLEVLQLIHFCDGPTLNAMDSGNNDLDVKVDDDYEERALLQQQLASLAEQETLIQGELEALLLSELEAVKKRRIAAQKRSMRSRHFLGAAERRLHFQRKEEQAALLQQIEGYRQEKAVLNRKAAIDRELQGYGIWSGCPKLKVVSVSSGATDSGNICVLKRINGGLRGSRIF